MKTPRRRAVWLTLLWVGVLGIGLHVHRRQLPQWTAAASPPVWRGVFHVHSAASHDSQTTPQSLATAAAPAQLDFIILTEHNVQEPWQRLKNVWLLSFAELSSRWGHVIAFANRLHTTQLPQRSARDADDATPLLAGLAAAGAMPIVAHPSDPKRPWTGTYTHTAGLEIVNVAASARRLYGSAPPWGWLRLASGLLTYAVNARLALAQLYDDDTAALQTWDAHPDPHMLGFCGLDAHGYLPNAAALRLWQLAVTPPPQATAFDPNALLTAIRQGHFFCHAALLDNAPTLQFTAIPHTPAAPAAQAGDSLRAHDVHHLQIRLAALTPGPTRLTLWRNGTLLHATAANELRVPQPAPGTYRVQVFATLPNILWGTHEAPVLYSNRLRLL